MGSAASSIPPSAASADLKDVLSRAKKRMGTLPVQGRYHRLPCRIEDSYIIKKKTLGSGCNGSVYAARSRHTSEKYAVKSFKLAGVDEDKRKELANEVEIILSMDHPNVVRLMEVYESEAEISLVMECMEGGELYDRVYQQKVFAEKDAALATQHMLRAVSYIHSEGIVHRDLKLENFMYDQRGGNFLKLIDFGFSKFFQKNQMMAESLGTVTYVAPEVLAKQYTRGSCDLWSLGVIVFVLLGGYMPFSGSNDTAILSAIKAGKYTICASRWASVSVRAQDFVQRLLVVRPAQRMTAGQAMAHPWLAQVRGERLLPGPEVGQAFVSFARASRFRRVCMQMMAWSISPDERRKLRDTFLDMDTSQAGVLKLADLEHVLEHDLRLPREDLALVVHTLRELDVDNDGDLHYSDFLAAMQATRLGEHNDKALRNAFRRFDVEGRGSFSAAQLQEMLGAKVSPREIERIFREVDGNGDGQITEEEFIAHIRDDSAAGDATASFSKVRTHSGHKRLLGRLRGQFQRSRAHK